MERVKKLYHQKSEMKCGDFLCKIYLDLDSPKAWACVGSPIFADFF